MTFCIVENIPLGQLGMIDWLFPLVFGLILKVLIQDQVMYYALVIACSVFSIRQFRVWVSNQFLSNVLNNLGSTSFLCILGSRMLFNLKEAGERGENEGTSYRSPSSTMSEMDFAEPANPQRESGTESGGSAENA